MSPTPARASSSIVARPWPTRRARSARCDSVTGGRLILVDIASSFVVPPLRTPVACPDLAARVASRPKADPRGGLTPRVSEVAVTIRRSPEARGGGAPSINGPAERQPPVTELASGGYEGSRARLAASLWLSTGGHQNETTRANANQNAANQTTPTTTPKRTGCWYPALLPQISAACPPRIGPTMNPPSGVVTTATTSRDIGLFQNARFQNLFRDRASGSSAESGSAASSSPDHHPSPIANAAREKPSTNQWRSMWRVYEGPLNTGSS